MQTIFEKLGGTYRQKGAYLFPNLEPPESPQIGIWGQRRLQYLRTNKNVLYMTMLHITMKNLLLSGQHESTRNLALQLENKMSS